MTVNTFRGVRVVPGGKVGIRIEGTGGGPSEQSAEIAAIAELCGLVEELLDLAGCSVPQDEVDDMCERAFDALRRFKPNGNH